MQKLMVSRRVLSGVLIALMIGGTASCSDGGGGSLGVEDQALATQVAAETPLAQGQAECLVGKLSSKGRAVLKGDTNLSELSIDDDGDGAGEIVAGVGSCAGSPFEIVFGYSAGEIGDGGP